MRAVGELKDPVGLAIAGLTAAAVIVVQEGLVVAVICGASVLVFRVAAGLLTPRVIVARATASPSTRWYAPLTAKQAEIALLVADGLTNREIAARLVVSERTVDNHVLHIMNKLGFHSRTQIGVWITERRMREERDKAKSP